MDLFASSTLTRRKSLMLRELPDPSLPHLSSARVEREIIGSRRVRTCVRALIFLFFSVPILAEDWPEFRGPTGQGISDERGLPLTWSETKNVKWKVAIPGRGWSSPAIQGDRIWLTTATEEGKSLRAICVDRNTGAIIQNVEVFRLKQGALKNGKNSQASPTPVLEGDRVSAAGSSRPDCRRARPDRRRSTSP
jgi:outer membrane protein assembly factor BamB